MCSKDKRNCQNFVSIFNQDSAAVYDALLGMAFAYPNLVVLENYKIIMRRDHRTMIGKVKILSGGGAGLEPCEVGYIGQGMLTAAVLGEVFVAPSGSSILVALRELALEHQDGILMLVKNYIGDTLNFSLALERALSEGITVKMLIVGDDASNPNPGKDGRRGMAGSVLVYKIAGAMAEAGKSLDDIFNTCREWILTDLNTVSVSLPTGYLKWEEIDLSNKENDAVIGMGIYGHPGRKVKYSNLGEIITYLLDLLFDSSSKSNIASELSPTVVLINNLGAVSGLEESVICKKTISEMLSHGIKIGRFYIGKFMPTLETKGFSITVLKIKNSDILEYLDAPTSAFNWPKPYLAKTDDISTIFSGMPEMSLPTVLPVTIQPTCEHDKLDFRRYHDVTFGPTLNQKETLALARITTFAAEALISCEKQINIIDLEVGDGDAGTMLKNGATAIIKALQEDRLNLANPFKFLQDLADICDKNIGGMTGALYKVFFRAGSTAFQKAHEITCQTWCDAFKKGLKSIMCYGRAEVGERTLLDALVPAAESLEEALLKHEQDLDRIVWCVACSSEYYADQTKKMSPTYLRGSNPKSVLLYPDAGAHAAAVWIRAVSFDLDEPAPFPGIFLWKFISEKEASFIMADYFLNKNSLDFFENKIGKDNKLLVILLVESTIYCREKYDDTQKYSSLLGLMYYTHLYFTSSRWRTPDETYNFFKESLLCHSLESPPVCMEIFQPNEAKEVLLFFIENYLRNLPLTRLLFMPHYKLFLSIKKKSKNSSDEIVKAKN